MYQLLIRSQNANPQIRITFSLYAEEEELQGPNNLTLYVLGQVISIAWLIQDGTSKKLECQNALVQKFNQRQETYNWETLTYSVSIIGRKWIPLRTRSLISKKQTLSTYTYLHTNTTW